MSESANLKSLDLRSDCPNAAQNSCSGDASSNAPVATPDDDRSSTTSDLFRTSESEETPLLKPHSTSEVRSPSARQYIRHSGASNSEARYSGTRNSQTEDQQEGYVDTRYLRRRDPEQPPSYSERQDRIRQYQSTPNLIELYVREGTQPMNQQLQADHRASQLSDSGGLPQSNPLRRVTSVSNIAQNIIIMHTEDDTESAKSLCRVVKKVCQKTNVTVQIWDDVCTGGRNAEHVKDDILSTSSILVFCVTDGFLRGYGEGRTDPTVTNLMYETLDNALQMNATG